MNIKSVTNNFITNKQNTLIKNNDLSALTIKKLENVLQQINLNPIFEVLFDNVIIDYVSIIAYEGLYQAFKDNSKLRDYLLVLRLELWQHNYGIPTVEFLLKYHNSIMLAKEFFIINKDLEFDNKTNNDINYLIQKIIVDMQTQKITSNPLLQVPLPPENETTGKFIKTYNKFGGFTTTASDSYSCQFIDFANSINNGVFLEIGAAFGCASLNILSNNNQLFCNDIEANNLAIVFQRALQSNTHHNLKLIPGEFPDELINLPKNSFDAILICRVLHFFSGEKILQSLNLLYDLLKPNGKLFIVCETPYLRNWQKFIPEYEHRVIQGWNWPGEINNPADFESSGRASTLPKFVHWLTKDILDQILIKTKFTIEKSSYIDRIGQFPNDLLLDGRESVGAIARKIL